MNSFKVTGTPGEPVRLDTLKPGDWYAATTWGGTFSEYPARVFGVHPDDPDARVCLMLRGATGRDRAYLPVHPLTRHELPDGTVEFRHVEPEQTYLDRLPEAVRDFIETELVYKEAVFVDTTEALARVIYENRDAIFAAGEDPNNGTGVKTDNGHNIGVADISEGDSDDTVHIYSEIEAGTGEELTPEAAIILARELVSRAIALAAKGGAQ